MCIIEKTWKISPYGRNDKAAQCHSERYGKLRANMERKGTPLTEADLRIASIAMHHNLIIVTGNTRHFSKIPGLKVEDWIHDKKWE